MIPRFGYPELHSIHSALTITIVSVGKEDGRTPSIPEPSQMYFHFIWISIIGGLLRSCSPLIVMFADQFSTRGHFSFIVSIYLEHQCKTLTQTFSAVMLLVIQAPFFHHFIQRPYDVSWIMMQEHWGGLPCQCYTLKSFEMTLTLSWLSNSVRVNELLMHLL